MDKIVRRFFWRYQWAMNARAAFLVLCPALACATAASADDRVFCQQGSGLISKFVSNNSGLPVKVEVIPPGAPTFVITNASQLPAAARCAATGTVTFLADASSDQGKSFHRVMSRTRALPGGGWAVDVAPDTFNGNFAYTAQFAIQVKAAH